MICFSVVNCFVVGNMKYSQSWLRMSPDNHSSSGSWWSLEIPPPSGNRSSLMGWEIAPGKEIAWEASYNGAQRIMGNWVAMCPGREILKLLACWAQFDWEIAASPTWCCACSSWLGLVAVSSVVKIGRIVIACWRFGGWLVSVIVVSG